MATRVAPAPSDVLVRCVYQRLRARAGGQDSPSRRYGLEPQVAQSRSRPGGRNRAVKDAAVEAAIGGVCGH